MGFAMVYVLALVTPGVLGCNDSEPRPNEGQAVPSSESAPQAEEPKSSDDKAPIETSEAGGEQGKDAPNPSPAPDTSGAEAGLSGGSSPPSGRRDAATVPGAEPSGQPAGTFSLRPDCTQPTVKAQCDQGYCTVEPGCFAMGAPRSEWGAGKNSDRQVQVTLTRAFRIGQTEVTRKQWEAAGFQLPERSQLAGDADCAEPSCPVSNVSFLDAIAFANRYSEQQDLAPCYALAGCTGEVGKDYRCESIKATAESVYACEGYRLPTEAEWEYAARGGTGTAFFTGEITPLDHESDCALDAALDRIAWYCHNSNGRAHPAGEKEANGWGLHDTAGNVFEWCNDLFDGTGYGDGPLVDPTGSLTPGNDLTPPRSTNVANYLRIARGGNHVSSSTVTKASKRFSINQEAADSGIGFRLVRTVRPGSP